jgi:hypothetical protein
MVYEVLISTTIAMILLPFNFWIAAELVVFIGMLTMAWELRPRRISHCPAVQGSARFS